MKGWIGVDLDGTLAKYDGWMGEDTIGAPILPMVERVQNWLEEGKTVKIFTARASTTGRGIEQRQKNIALIKAWCLKYIGQELEVTSDKDWGMIQLWDDRCIQVEFNAGNPIR